MGSGIGGTRVKNGEARTEKDPLRGKKSTGKKKKRKRGG